MRVVGARNLIEKLWITMNLKLIVSSLFALAFIQLSPIATVKAQEKVNRYDEAIRAFLRQDSVSFPKKGSVLFVGSSSIGRWRDLEQRLSEYTVIRRGFGGSTFAEILHYAKDIVLPYRPSKIFLYAGENDLVQGKSVPEIMGTIEKIHQQIKQTLPFTTLCIISVKPSIKLEAYSAEIVTLNESIKAYVAKVGCSIHFVDIFHSMLDEQGELKSGIFVSDNLHLSPSGYDIWEDVIRKYL